MKYQTINKLNVNVQTEIIIGRVWSIAKGNLVKILPFFRGQEFSSEDKSSVLHLENSNRRSRRPDTCDDRCERCRIQRWDRSSRHPRDSSTRCRPSCQRFASDAPLSKRCEHRRGVTLVFLRDSIRVWLAQLHRSPDLELWHRYCREIRRGQWPRPVRKTTLRFLIPIRPTRQEFGTKRKPICSTGGIKTMT